MKKKKSPLNRRILYELLGEWKKYSVIGILLILIISFVSGMYVANHSMLHTFKGGKEKYIIEDGHFELKEKVDKAFLNKLAKGQKVKSKLSPEMLFIKSKLKSALFNKKNKKKVKKIPVTIYENFYKDATEKRLNKDNGEAKKSVGTIRVYKKRNKINKGDLFKGRWAKKNDEIVIDRMHADNVHLKVNDTIKVNGLKYKIVGLGAFSDYQCLFEKPTDIMFDSIDFNVGMVTKKGFDRIKESIHYNYSYIYSKKPMNHKFKYPKDDIEKKKWSDNFIELLSENVFLSGNELVKFLPEYANQAIHFAEDDMGSDKAMGGVLLYIFTAVLGFIFAITLSSTINKEASVIGTLRAMGYTKHEILIHYMSMPVLVIIIASIIGNILGYTYMKEVVVSMYYNSYSLPMYKTTMSTEALVKTTIIPIIIMFIVNYSVIKSKLNISPLRFLRHEMRISKRKKTIRLPKWSFFSRFRLRVIFQNISGYVMLFIGITFIMILLSMSIGMPQTLDYCKRNANKMVIAKYQTVLRDYKKIDKNSINPFNPNMKPKTVMIDTKTKGKEKFQTLTLIRKGKRDEPIITYGVKKNSKYVKIPNLKDNDVYISRTYHEKFDVNVGDTILLKEKYSNKKYKFKVSGIYKYDAAIAMFMTNKTFNKRFHKEKGYFSGFFSNNKIKDLDKNDVLYTITKHDITKLTDQMDHSMGSYMAYYQVILVSVSVIIIYLITKLIIEKNENAISMIKIMGYKNKEIGLLYIVPTTVLFIVFELISMNIGIEVVSFLWKMVMQRVDGYFGFLIEIDGVIKMFLFVFIAYSIVSIMDFIRIKHVPMDKVLKE